jgi:hypothetical protein
VLCVCACVGTGATTHVLVLCVCACVGTGATTHVLVLCVCVHVLVLVLPHMC